MKKHTRIIIGLILLVVLATAGIGAQSQDPQSRPVIADPILDSLQQELRGGGISRHEVVPKIWLKIKSLNRDRFPNPDLVLPGEEIELPDGTMYTAQHGGTDHMWSSAEYYMDHVVWPYLSAPYNVLPQDTTNVVANTDDESDWWHWWYLPAILIVAAAIIVGSRAYARSLRFIPDPPDFRSGSDEAVRVAAQSAAQRAFSHSVQIVGPIERGLINGRQIMFFANGDSQTETFDNEPGYRARVRFRDQQERVVVCRWACFNPCYNGTDASFDGTFTPEGSTTPERIAAMNPSQVTTLTRGIQSTDSRVISSDLPVVAQAETDSKPVPSSAEETPTEVPAETPKPVGTGTEVPVIPTEADGKVHLTRLQLSTDKGINMEGQFALTVPELHDLLFQVTGRHPKQVDAKPEQK